jgi:hypothetical protein
MARQRWTFLVAVALGAAIMAGCAPPDDSAPVSDEASAVLRTLPWVRDVRPIEPAGDGVDAEGLTSSASGETDAGTVYLRLYETPGARAAARDARNVADEKAGTTAFFVECGRGILWIPRDEDDPSLLEQQTAFRDTMADGTDECTL